LKLSPELRLVRLPVYVAHCPARDELREEFRGTFGDRVSQERAPEEVSVRTWLPELRAKLKEK